MYSALLTFPAKGLGAGAQVVPGVVDAATGTPFVAKIILPIYGFAALNALTADAGFTNAFCLGMGVDSGVVASGIQMADISEFLFPPNKIASVCDGTGLSIVDVRANAFFGGDIFRQAYVSAIGVGTFTITYLQNDRTGDTISCVVLGGDDLTVDLGQNIQNLTYATPAPPVGLLCVPPRTLSSSHGAATGVGGGGLAVGWDAKNSGRGVAGVWVKQNAGNARVQLADRCFTAFDGVGVLEGGSPAVTTWTDTGYEITGAGVGYQFGGVRVGFCGAAIQTAAGVVSQPGSPGDQAIAIGFVPSVVWLISDGTVLGSAPDTVQGQLALGTVVPGAQTGIWAGETASGVVPALGARYLSDQSVLRFGSANAGSTVFGAEASATLLDDVLTLHWASVDGIPKSIQWFAVGGAPPIPPLTPGCTVPTAIGAIGGSGGGCVVPAARQA